MRNKLTKRPEQIEHLFLFRDSKLKNIVIELLRLGRLCLLELARRQFKIAHNKNHTFLTLILDDKICYIASANDLYVCSKEYI